MPLRRPHQRGANYVGLTAPAEMENNWVQTIPGKGWNPLLRLYGAPGPWFDKA